MTYTLISNKKKRIDSSALVAIAFNEPSASILTRTIIMCEMVIFSTFLEAKLRSAFVRESVEIPESWLPGIGWTLPDRPLINELAIALDAGISSGENLWHVASALYAAEDPRQVNSLRPWITSDSLLLVKSGLKFLKNDSYDIFEIANLTCH